MRNRRTAPRRRWRTARLAIVLVVSALAAGAQPARAQQDDREPETRTPWDIWLEAVETHVPGELDAPLLGVAQWSRGDFDGLLPPFSRHPVGDRARIVDRAVVLHTDIAMLHRTQWGYDLPPGPTTTVLFQDGREIGQMFGTFHWDFARRLIDRLPRGEQRQRIGRQFYRATAAVLQLWGEYPELTTHLTAGRRLLGDDPVLLMYEGTQRQSDAGPRVQRFLDERRRESNRVSLPVSSTGAPRPLSSAASQGPSEQAARLQAEQLFRRALDLDPELAEARIRLAHVLGDRGRHAEAAAALARATTRPLPRVLDYYAALLTGRARRALGELEAAEHAFERAAHLFPRAPAPRYGLSEIAIARGDRSASLSHLLAASSYGRLEGDEPWWWLLRAHEPAAVDLVDEMRRGVIR